MACGKSAKPHVGIDKRNCIKPTGSAACRSCCVCRRRRRRARCRVRCWRSAPRLCHVRPSGSVHAARRPELKEPPLGGGQQRLNGHKHFLGHLTAGCTRGGAGRQGQAACGRIRQQQAEGQHRTMHLQCSGNSRCGRRGRPRPVPCPAKHGKPSIQHRNHGQQSPCRLTVLEGQAVKGDVGVALVPQLNILPLACGGGAADGWPPCALWACTLAGPLPRRPRPPASPAPGTTVPLAAGYGCRQGGGAAHLPGGTCRG